ncbi:MAG: hypothetical protein E4H01_11900 [Lysobacterales bacterium]|nr:MAG: hypothetical protein E4H01_11900 [Xanthomonadales bacterium]
MKILCIHCGGTSDEHHEFEAHMPSGCRCDPGEWDVDVNEICEKYLGDGNGDYCIRCEHDEGCQKAELSPAAAAKPKQRLLPDQMVDALQDKAHKDTCKVRPGKSKRIEHE